MTSLGIIRALGVVAGAFALFLLAWGWAARQRRRRALRGRGRAEPGLAEPGLAGPEAAHRLELRLATLERGQADLAARLEGAGGAEERLQATAGQLLGLVRDKNATIETALAGLDQLRGRMRVLEQIGDAAEARGLFERLGERLAALESAMAATAGRGDDGAAQAALVEQLTRLFAQKDAALEAVLGRLVPVEARLARLEGETPGETVARLDARLDGLRDAQGAAQAALAALRAEMAAATAPAGEIAERLARLHAQKDALFERLAGRLAALEAELAARDPAPALEALGGRLDALRERLVALETPGESPFAAVSEQLTRLYAQKDAATEAVLQRLAPVEARLEELGREMTAADPAVERLAAGVAELRLAQAALGAGLEARLLALETPGESPFAAVSEQLTRLYAQKDAATEAVLQRLAPVEARLEELGREMTAADPAVERLAAGVDEVRLAQAALGAGLEARLVPMEARVVELAQAAASGDPAVDQLAAGLDEVRLAQAGVIGRLAALETPGESPFAAVSEQLTRLYAQKDAATGAVLARLGEVEAQAAAAAEAGVRLAALGERVGALEAPESPLAAISEQLARLYGQKDAAVEAVLARLAPVEARLDAIGQAVAAGDPAVERLAQGIEEARAGQAAAAVRLGERLSALEQATGDARAEGRDAEDAARAEAQAIADQLIALRAATAQTELFADRLALLEASLPRLSSAQALMMQALERQAGAPPVAEPEPVPAAAPDASGRSARSGPRSAGGGVAASAMTRAVQLAQSCQPNGIVPLSCQASTLSQSRLTPAGNPRLTVSPDPCELRRPVPQRGFPPWTALPPTPRPRRSTT